MKKLYVIAIIFIAILASLAIINSQYVTIQESSPADVIFHFENVNITTMRGQGSAPGIMYFEKIAIDDHYIQFNDVKIYVDSSNPLNITLNYLYSDPINISHSALIMNFTAITTGGTVWFNLTGLKPNYGYMYKVDGGAMTGLTSDSSGCINFSHNSWSTHFFTLYDSIDILIDDDAEFTANNGITAGTGTSANPYILDGYSIINKLEIYGTTKYFIARNFTITSYIYIGKSGAPVTDGTCRIDNISSDNLTSSVIWIRRNDYASITNCTFTDDVPSDDSGILNIDSTDCFISNCTFTKMDGSKYNARAIVLAGSSSADSIIENCTFNYQFIAIRNPSHSIIRNCTFNHIYDDGIITFSSSYTNIDNCYFTNNCITGIEIQAGTHNVNITNCTFDNIHEGISSFIYTPQHVNNITIAYCNFNNFDEGVRLQDADNVSVHDCYFTNGTGSYNLGLILGVYSSISSVHNCWFYDNYFMNNNYGICIGPSASYASKIHNNVFYNNYFASNTKHVYNYYMGYGPGNLALNKWNITKILGTNIIGKPYLGGNYWDNYTGVDTNGDYLGDSYLPIYYDYHPLVSTTGSTTITTNEATLVEETTATFNGVQTGLTGATCGFLMGTSLAQIVPPGIAPLNVTCSGTYNSGIPFNYAKGGVKPAYYYYFRAWTYKLGSVYTYDASYKTFLTKPECSVVNIPTINPTNISISWNAPMSHSDTTATIKNHFRYKTTGYPTSNTDGTLICNLSGDVTSTPHVYGYITPYLPNTTYYIRGWAVATQAGYCKWSDDYTSISVTTPPIVVPPALYTLTLNATSIEETSAILRGVMTGDNNTVCGFLISNALSIITPPGSPISNITCSGTYNSGMTFSYTKNDLVPADYYYYRAWSHNHTSGVYNYSSTVCTFFTKPTPPNYESPVLNPTNIIVRWSKSAVGEAGVTQKNYFRYSTNGYPTTITSGTLIGNFTGDINSIPPVYGYITSIMPGLTYYISGWTFASESSHYQWSDTYVMISQYVPTNYSGIVNFTAKYVTSNTINLSWSGSNNTIILRKTTSYPTSITDGTIVYSSAPPNGLYAGNRLDFTGGDVLFYNGYTWELSYDGSTTMVASLCEYNNKLYAGTAYQSGNGDVFVYDGISWTKSYEGSQEYITSLCVYNGKLYAGQGSGSGDGDVLVFDGSTWSTSYDGSTSIVWSLCVYNDILYAGLGSSSGNGDIMAYNSSNNTWWKSYDSTKFAILGLGVYDNKLLAGTTAGGSGGDGDIFAYSSTNHTWWTFYDGAQEAIYCFANYSGNLYVGQGWSNGDGDVLVYNGATWAISYNGGDNVIYALCVYNNKLYAANGYDTSDGNILVFDGAAWTTSYDGSGTAIHCLAVVNISDLGNNYFIDTISPDTNYYYTAWDYNNYNATNNTKCLFIRTINATSIEETSATLNAYIISDSTNTVRFQYGYTTAYGTNTTDQTKSEVQAITNYVSGLIPGRLYHFRSVAINGTNRAYGQDKYFLTKPEAPTNPNVNLVSGPSLNLSWTKGTGANNTVVLMKTTGAPSSPSDGTIIYNGTGTYVIFPFSIGNTYYFNAWSFSVGGFSETSFGLWNFNDGWNTITSFTAEQIAGCASDAPIDVFASILDHLDWVWEYPSLKNYEHGGSGNTLLHILPGTVYYVQVSGGCTYTIGDITVLYQYSDNSTLFTNLTLGGLFINCFDENTHANLTFNVKISNPSGSEVYENNGCTNTHVINASLCPQGNNIQIIVSATGYQQRVYTLNIYSGIFYLLNAYLPPVTQPGNETIHCELRQYIDSKTVSNYAIDTIVPLTKTLDTMIGVELYNKSLYGSYGGWIFITSDNYSFTTTQVTIENSIQDANTTMVRITYYYNFCTGGIESALYNLRVIDEYDTSIENAFVEIKRYINTSGVFVLISSLYTDANGYIAIYLIPNAHYKIFINKSGYDSTMGDYFPISPNAYGQTEEKWFRIYHTTPEGIPTFSDAYNFHVAMYSNNTINIVCEEIIAATIDAQFYLYETFNATITLVNSYSYTGTLNVNIWESGINTSRMHVVILYVNHSLIGYSIQTLYILPITNNQSMINGTWLENKISSNFGNFQLGWINTIFLFIPAVCLIVLFAVAHQPGLGLFFSGCYLGGIIKFIQFDLGTATKMGMLCGIFIMLGILMIIAKRKGWYD